MVIQNQTSIWEVKKKEKLYTNGPTIYHKVLAKQRVNRGRQHARVKLSKRNLLRQFKITGTQIADMTLCRDLSMKKIAHHRKHVELWQNFHGIQ